jgi:hypothetical protein
VAFAVCQDSQLSLLFLRTEPLMTKFHNVGISRTTGIEYTTSVLEAVGIEHKETTRYVGTQYLVIVSFVILNISFILLYRSNYDILAAVFTDVLKYMHDDLGLISKERRDNTREGETHSEDSKKERIVP